MRACRTPDLPSSRQHTASRVPLTSIRSRLCRTWVESTWYEGRSFCLPLREPVNVRSSASVRLFVRGPFGQWSSLTAGGCWQQQAKIMWFAFGSWRLLSTTSTTWDWSTTLKVTSSAALIFFILFRFRCLALAAVRLFLFRFLQVGFHLLPLRKVYAPLNLMIPEWVKIKAPFDLWVVQCFQNIL